MGLLVPFLTALTAPQKLHAIWGMDWLGALLEVQQPQQLLLPLTVLLTGSALLGALLRSTALLISAQLAARLGHDLSATAYASILYADYSIVAQRNSSELIGILSEVDQFISLVFRPLLQMLSSGLIALVVGFGLMLINPSLAMALALIAVSLYLVISRLSERRVQQVNQGAAGLREHLLRLQQESMTGIRYIQISGSQKSFLESYNPADLALRLLDSTAFFFSMVPRYGIEGLGIALLCVSTFVVFSLKGAAVAIPTIGVLTLATQRFLPAVQEAYASATLARSRRYILKQLLDVIAVAGIQRVGSTTAVNTQSHVITETLPPLGRQIKLDQVAFAYGDGREIFRNFSLTIEQGSMVAIVGPTGTGKSTLLDLILGFALPKAGAVLVDGVALMERDSVPIDRRRSWHQQIAYVPQHIYLSDASILDNIVFGASDVAPNEALLRLACAAACLSEFIASLPEGLSTRVGERGARLSGGQRQRIGIARALYQNKPVLILDEPTNSLDAGTEEEILISLQRLPRHFTVVVVTHSQHLAAGMDRIVEIRPSSQIGAQERHAS